MVVEWWRSNRFRHIQIWGFHAQNVRITCMWMCIYILYIIIYIYTYVYYIYSIAMAIIQFLNGIDAISRICQAYCSISWKLVINCAGDGSRQKALMNHPSISFHTLG
jgi:hypothetical protein